MTKGPLSHQKMKYSFLYYIQLLMIGQAIRVMKVDQNAKKSNVVSVRVFCCLSLGVLLFQSGCSVVSVWVFCCLSLGLLLSQLGSSVVSVWVFSTPPTPPRWKGRNSGCQEIKVFQIYIQQVSTQGQFCSVSSSPPGNAAHL